MVGREEMIRWSSNLPLPCQANGPSGPIGGVRVRHGRGLPNLILWLRDRDGDVGRNAGTWNRWYQGVAHEVSVIVIPWAPLE